MSLTSQCFLVLCLGVLVMGILCYMTDVFDFQKYGEKIYTLNMTSVSTSNCNCILYDLQTRHCNPQQPGVPVKRITIYLEVVGRFGNILFEIAGAYALAKDTNVRLVVKATELLKAFEHKPFETIDGKQWNKLKMTYINARHQLSDFIKAFDTASSSSFKFVHMHQRYAYFGGCADEIRHKLALKKSIIAKADQVIMNIVSTHLNLTSAKLKGTSSTSNLSDVTTVGIHVRRGDIANADSRKDGYRLPSALYFRDAMNYFKQRYSNVIFIVATNGRDWVNQTLLQEGVYLSPLKSPIEDMALLSRCDHVIISLGTFSWWAGFYNQGTVIYYKNWVAPNSKLWKRMEYNEQERFPPNWIPMT